MKKAIIEQIGEKITVGTLSSLREIDWIEYRAEAEEGWEPISILDGLENCVNLKNLALDGNRIRSLKPLRNAANLEELWLVQNEITDLTGISGCKKLKQLVLDMNYKLSDISPIKEIDSLTYLNINETKISDLSAIDGKISLEKLSINDTQVTDLTPLESLSNLKHVALNRIPADVSEGTKNREILISLIKRGVEVYIEIIDELK